MIQKGCSAASTAVVKNTWWILHRNKKQGGSVRFQTISVLNDSVPFFSARFGSVPLISRVGSVRCCVFWGPVRFDLTVVCLAAANSSCRQYKIEIGPGNPFGIRICWCSSPGYSQFQPQAIALKGQRLQILVRQTRPENETWRIAIRNPFGIRICWCSSPGYSQFQPQAIALKG